MYNDRETGPCPAKQTTIPCPAAFLFPDHGKLQEIVLISAQNLGMSDN